MPSPGLRFRTRSRRNTGARRAVLWCGCGWMGSAAPELLSGSHSRDSHGASLALGVSLVGTWGLVWTRMVLLLLALLLLPALAPTGILRWALWVWLACALFFSPSCLVSGVSCCCSALFCAPGAVFFCFFFVGGRPVWPASPLPRAFACPSVSFLLSWGRSPGVVSPGFPSPPPGGSPPGWFPGWCLWHAAVVVWGWGFCGVVCCSRALPDRPCGCSACFCLVGPVWFALPLFFLVLAAVRPPLVGSWSGVPLFLLAARAVSLCVFLLSGTYWSGLWLAGLCLLTLSPPPGTLARSPACPWGRLLFPPLAPGWWYRPWRLPCLVVLPSSSAPSLLPAPDSVPPPPFPVPLVAPYSSTAQSSGGSSHLLGQPANVSSSMSALTSSSSSASMVFPVPFTNALTALSTVLAGTACL